MRTMTYFSTAFAAAVLTLSATSVFAATCDTSAMPAAPVVPAPAERTASSMYDAQNEVKSFVSASREHLKCVRSTSKHNALVDQVYAVADQYNTALQEFKSSTR